MRYKKALSLVLTLILIFISTVPFLNTYALPNTLGSTLVPGKFSNVTYKVKPGVKTMPGTLNYNTRLMELSDLLGKNSNIQSLNTYNQSIGTPTPGAIKLPGVGSISPQAGTTQPTVDIDTSLLTVKDLKYPIGSSYMVLNNDVAAFQPKAGEIYLDNTKKTALKVIGSPVFDKASGKKVIPISKTAFNDVFENYKIPEQKIQVNKANVSYIAPTAADEDGASYIDIQQTKEIRNVSLASLGDTSVKIEDDCMVVKIKNVTLYEYPEPEKDKNKDKDKEAGSESYEENQENTQQQEGYYEEKAGDESGKESNPSNNAEGVSEASEVKIKIKVEEGTLKIYKPRAFASVDIGLLTQEIKVGFESDMVSEIKLKGELKFNKVIETCIFGYDIEIPYGRAFIGVFLIVDAKGQVEVKAKVISEGKMQVGLKAEAIAFIPVYVGPFAEPIIDEIKVGFSADGEVTAKIALMPQVGLVICDYEIAVFQLWLALKANAEFHIQTEGGLDTNTLDVSGDISGEGHLKLDAYAEFIGYLLGYKYSFFYKEWNLYDNTWTFGKSVEGGASTLEPIYGNISLSADAYENKIRGSVSYFDNTAKRSIGTGGINFGSDYKGDDLIISIKDRNGQTETFGVSTDFNGDFELIKEITPLDKVSASLNTTVTDGKGTKRNLIGSTPVVTPTIPFNKFTFVADAFNDVVSGTVSDGHKTPDRHETMYSGRLIIDKIDKTGKRTQSTAYAVNGEFSKPIALVEGDQIKVTLPFEGAVFPENPETKQASLDALKIFFNIDRVNNKINGSIQNLYEAETTSAYKGDVKFKAYMPSGGRLIGEFGQQRAKVHGLTTYVRDKKNPLVIITKIIESNSSTFSTPFECLVFTIEINHDGIKKVITYDPFAKLGNIAKEPLQNAVTNPVDDKIDSIINPADLTKWAGVWECDYLGSVVFRVDGNKIIGTYDDGNSLLNASVSNNKLVGTLDENGGEPKSFEFTLSSDGKALSGKWYSSRNVAGYALSGQRRTLPSLNIISPAISKSLWTGVWYTDLGTMILNQEGQKVIGTLGRNELPVTGIIVGNTFKGSLKENGFIRKFEFNMSYDGANFETISNEELATDDSSWHGWGFRQNTKHE